MKNRERELVLGNIEGFLGRVMGNLGRVGIEVEGYELDHLGYRAVTGESYEQKVEELEGLGARIHRKIIRERPVDIYRLTRPIEYGERKIQFLELMAPAVGDKFSEGLEHAEFVVEDMSLQELIERYSNLKWSINGIDREIGPEVIVYFEDGTSAKFHTMSIEKIVELEEGIS